ncbi:MAG: RNA polymerase sigma factor [Acidimicrobiia bacterium]
MSPTREHVQAQADQPAAFRITEFEVFYDLAWGSVFRPLAVTLGDPELAAEAVDEAMTRAFARWRFVQQMSNPEGWVYRVAYRWAIDRLRRHRTERRLLAKLARVPFEEATIRVEPGLGAALETLSVEQRSVVVLACAFDWSEREIALALGVRPGTVKSRLSRGLERLRRELSV